METCPLCGNHQYKTLAPNLFECLALTVKGIDVVVGPVVTPCGHRWQGPLTVGQLTCVCGMGAVGVCHDCGLAVCYAHGVRRGVLLCESCDGVRSEAFERERLNRETAQAEREDAARASLIERLESEWIPLIRAAFEEFLAEGDVLLDIATAKAVWDAIHRSQQLPATHEVVLFRWPTYKPDPWYRKYRKAIQVSRVPAAKFGERIVTLEDDPSVYHLWPVQPHTWEEHLPVIVPFGSPVSPRQRWGVIVAAPASRSLSVDGESRTEYALIGKLIVDGFSETLPPVFYKERSIRMRDLIREILSSTQ